MSEKKQNVMPIPTKEKFSLSKVKLLKDGGLSGTNIRRMDIAGLNV